MIQRSYRKIGIQRIYGRIFGLRFVDEAIGEKKPFLLYLAHNAPHFPLQAPEEEIAKFRGKYLKGWEKLRQERYEKQIKLGLIDPSWKLPPINPNVPRWESLSEQLIKSGMTI
jgi:arylsulfatase A-like enzyme